MSSTFDFASLLQFLMSLFEAFKKLAEKLGFSFGDEETTKADETTTAQA
jgi:hypothetical protein